MPDRVIPCERCEEIKKLLEKGGIWEVVSCQPIKYNNEKCRIIYKKKQKIT